MSAVLNAIKRMDASHELAQALAGNTPPDLLARPADVGSPIIGALDWAIRKSESKRPTARPQPVRASESGDCARAIAFAVMERAGVEGVVSAPRSAADIVSMSMGTETHNGWFADAMAVLFGLDAFELECGWELPQYRVSGHSDACGVGRDAEGRRTLVELKTANGTYYRIAMGIPSRRGGKVPEPQGVRKSAFLQGALNALAKDCDVLAIPLIAREAVSRQMAEALWGDPDDPRRVMGVWTWEREEWEPAAHAEGKRLKGIADMVDKGIMPLPILQDGRRVVDPSTGECTSGYPTWCCSYCGHRALCVAWESQEVMT